MMTQKDLQLIFESEFNWDNWKKVMNFVFPEFQFALTQQQVPLDNELRRRHANHIKQHGSGELADGEKIVLFEISLKESVRLDRNVKSVRKLISNEIFKGYQIGLGVFHNDDKTKWRFTLVVREFSEALTVIDKKPESYTYVFGKNEKGRTAAKRFFDLAKKPSKGLSDLEDAFSVKALSDDFFSKYKEVYKDFETDIVKNPSRLSLFKGSDREKAARDFVKRMMGRVIFLYFLQKREWMGCETKWENGDEKFMKHFFEAAEPNELFYHNYLQPLFFHVLAEKRTDIDEDCIINGKNFRKVPYLNGGLFEKDEDHPEMLTLSHSIFAKFFDVLESYNFTIIEDDPEYREVAVDPEMLGHIFENLLEDNKEKGAFYTPKEVVQYMCRESLLEYLTTKLSDKVTSDTATLKEALRQFVMLHHFAPINDIDQRADEYIIKALKDVKICDPAIGSGAFPMGILHEMFRLIEFFEDRDTLYSIWGIEQWDAARFKESIIQNSIYGVDIEKGAVDIARLRFWLSIIIDEKEPKPLPNLDYKIVVGDSLLSKFHGHILEVDWNIKVDATLKGDKGVLVAKLAKRIKDGLQVITQKQEEFFHPDSDNKDTLLTEIRNLKIELLLDQLKYNKGKYIDTHPPRGGFAPNAKDKKYNLEVELEIKKFDDLQLALQKLLQDTDKPFNHFDWNLDFPEVLNPLIKGENRGFDIIIANPPYMRVQEITKSLPEDKEALEAKYDNAKMSYDLANLFFELAVKLSHARSTNCFIFPHKFFNAASAEVFRDYLLKGKFVDKIVHFGANMVFNEADTYTCITHFSPVSNDGFHLKKFEFGANWRKALTNLDFSFINYSKIEDASKLYGSNQWIFFNNEKGYAAFSKIYDGPKSKLLDKFEDIFQGLATSNDKLYFLRVTHEDSEHYFGVVELNNEPIQVEKKFFKPILKGKGVHRYASLSTDLCVFFPYDNDGTIVELDDLRSEYPLTYKYVKAYEQEFKNRERGKARTMKYWYAYIYPKNLTKFEQPKLSSMEICSKHPNVTLNYNNLYHPTTVYSWVKKNYVKESYEYFLAIANSSLLWWFLKNTGDTLQGDARRLKTNYLNPFPMLSEISQKTDAFFRARVEEIMKLKSLGRDTEGQEKEVDTLVLKLYGLSYDEAIEVDPGLSITSEEYSDLPLL